MDMLLIAGPVVEPTQPALAIPTLAGCLRAQGYTVRAWDLSVECFNEMTSPHFLSAALGRIDHRGMPGDTGDAKRFHIAAMKAKVLGPTVLENIEQAKATLRDQEAFYDYPRYEGALGILAGAYAILQAAYFPTTISFYRYDMGTERTAAHIRAHLVDAAHNMFYEHFASRTVPQIVAMDPAALGLSVTYEAQLLPALTLCALVKASKPNTPIILGGAYLTAVSPQLAKTDYLWDLIDGVVLYEGESALVEICKRVKAGKDLVRIPNLFGRYDRWPDPNARHEAEPTETVPIHIEDIRDSPPPDFSDFSFGQYLTPEPVVPIQSCRGCYWGKCAFCAVSVATSQAYRQRPVEQFIRDMTTIHAATGARTFCLCDDATSVKYMTQLADHIRAHALPYAWATEARLEPALDADTCKRLAEGGCVHLSFGFESASDRVLSLMHKGTRTETTVQVLNALADAQIGVELQSFIGFPGETLAEAQQTAAFFQENRRLYTAMSMTTFEAMAGSRVVRDPEAYHVAIRNAPQDILSRSCEIVVREGMSREVVRDQYEALRTEFFVTDVPVTFISGGMAHQFLYLRKYGRRYVDALWATHHARSHDLTRSVITVCPDTRLQAIGGGDHLIYNSRGTARHVGEHVARAVRLLERQPQTLSSAAQHIEGQGVRTDRGALGRFSDLELELLLLAKLHYLVVATIPQ